MGGNEFITFALVVTGLVIICALYADFMTRRAYGLLALTLLAIVALGYLWPPALSRTLNWARGNTRQIAL